MTLLTTVFFFLVTIVLLVVFHEFGHFWVARRLGVKVIRFSVGFGKPIWRWRRKNDETEYVLAPWPVGGYVQMLDEREGPVAAEERHREFNSQPLLYRTAIILAGPFANFIFAVFAFWLTFMIGVPGPKPVVGEVVPASIAASAGVQAGDEIVEVAGQRTPTWESTRYAILSYVLSRKPVSMVVKNADLGERRVTLPLGTLAIAPEPGSDLLDLGIKPWRPPEEPVIGQVLPGSPGDLYGLKLGDRILEVDGRPITDWSALVKEIQTRPEQSMILRIERDGNIENIKVVPKKEVSESGPIGKLGVGNKRGNYPDEMKGIDRYGPLAALVKAWQRTWQVTVLTLQMIEKIIVGEASVKNISGPISIAQFAGISASMGLTWFISFLALVSVSLFIINLLPIPILDGGHLVLFAAEWIKGKPVSEMAQVQFRAVGLVMVVLLMSLAIYNDVVRLF